MSRRRRRTRRRAATREARGDAAETRSDSSAARRTRSVRETADAERRLAQRRPRRGRRSRVDAASPQAGAREAGAAGAAGRRHLPFVETAARCRHRRLRHLRAFANSRRINYSRSLERSVSGTAEDVWRRTEGCKCIESTGVGKLNTTAAQRK